jgi:hypothetical protein
VVIYTWPGQPANPTNQYSGAKWKRPDEWFTYQKKTFVTPAFPGYVSGHSTFSRAAAEVMTAITGSPFFPGGLGTFTAQSNAFLTFERGPNQTVELQWATYFDAADQAGLSRLWGGIHVSVDDLTGRRVGQICGQSAWVLARSYFDGSITNTPVHLAIGSTTGGDCQIQFNAVRGFRYELQCGSDLVETFPQTTIPLPIATGTRVFLTNTFAGSRQFFRVVTMPNP